MVHPSVSTTRVLVTAALAQAVVCRWPEGVICTVTATRDAPAKSPVIPAQGMWLVRGGGAFKAININSGSGGAKAETEAVEVSRPVSLFGPEDKELDRYSAALAATQSLRQERDKVIKDTTNPLAYFYLSVTKPRQHNRWMSSPWVGDKARRAQKKYLSQAGNIIRSNGLTTNRYNELSHILGKRKDLREKVQQQADLYRVNADTRTDKTHPVLDLAETSPTVDRRAKGQQVVADRAVATDADKQHSAPAKKVQQFAKSLTEIEALRRRHRRRLMNELGCEELPQGLCRPSMGGIAPRVRKACERFPVVAERIVKANGLKPEEFNRLSARSRSNVLYRWQVRRCLRKLDTRLCQD